MKRLVRPFLAGVLLGLLSSVGNAQHVSPQAQTFRDFRTFGGVCDGTTDDATAFSTATTWLSSASNRVVQLPAGTCATSATVSYGDGRQQSTTLTGAAAGTTLSVASCSGVVNGDAVAVVRDDGTTFTTTASSCVGTTLTLAGAYSGGTASSGNAVFTGKISSYNGGGFVGFGSGATTAEWPGGADITAIKYTGSAAAATTLGAGASAGDKQITVAAITNIALATPVGVTLDNGRIWWSWAAETPTGTTVKLGNAIPSAAANGNAVNIANNPVVKINGPILAPRLENLMLDANSLAAIGLDAKHPNGGSIGGFGKGVATKSYTAIGHYIHSGEFYAGTATGTGQNDFGLRATLAQNTKTIGCWLRGTSTGRGGVAFSQNHFKLLSCRMGGNDVTAAGIRTEFFDNNVIWKASTTNDGVATSGAGLYRQPSINTLLFPNENVWIGPAFIGNVTDGTDQGGTGTLGSETMPGYATYDGETVPSSATLHGYTQSGVLFGALGANTYSATPANPTGTTSATVVHMGLAGTFTPKKTGKVLFTITGFATNDTANDGYILLSAYGTGAAPTNGAASGGTNCGNATGINISTIGATAGVRDPFSWTCIATMTIGTTYWLDLKLARITGGTASVGNITISASEQ